jgi:hypothetical protein
VVHCKLVPNKKLMNWTQGGLFLLRMAALEVKAVRYGNTSHLSGGEIDYLPVSSNSFNKQSRRRGASTCWRINYVHFPVKQIVLHEL